MSVQCTSSNGCRCLLNVGHAGDHNCGHGHWFDVEIRSSGGVLGVREGREQGDEQ